MKNLLKRIGIFCLCFTVAFGFSACGGAADYRNDPNVLHISVWSGGYGTEWLKAVGRAYEAKHENITVKYEEATLRERAIIPLTNPSVYDIVISDSFMTSKYAKYPQYSGYDKTFHSIKEVFDYTPEGERGPIRSKMSENVLDWCTSDDGENYFIPVSSSLWGLTYNVDILAAEGIAVPRTTDEMKAAFDRFKGKKVKAHIFSGYTDYWQPIVYTWWAQYDGLKTFNNFFKGQTVDGEYLVDIFGTQGRYEAVKCADDFLGYGSFSSENADDGYFSKTATGLEYMPAQLKYLQGEAAFMANGGWLENEMRDSFKNATMANIANMKVPVISSITDRFASDSDKSDAKLIEIIDYVDGGKVSAKPSGVTDADIAIVEEARSLTYMTGAEMTAVVPVTSTKSDLAKDFLKFMYSDEGAKIVLMADAGTQLPVNTDFSSDADINGKLTEFGKSRMRLLSGGTTFFKSFKEPIVYDGGLSAYAIGRTFEKAFASVYVNDRTTAEAYYRYDIDYYTANNGTTWTNLLRTVGLVD